MAAAPFRALLETTTSRPDSGIFQPLQQRAQKCIKGTVSQDFPINVLLINFTVTLLLYPVERFRDDCNLHNFSEIIKLKIPPHDNDQSVHI